MTEESTPLSLEEACAARGMRMTDQRRIIARVLEQAIDHPDVEEVYRRASAIDSNISISTVYRTVKLFDDAGMIARLDFRDGRSRYEPLPDEHHDHLIDFAPVRSSSSTAMKSRRCSARWLASLATS
jgi:ferric uptake regulator, Fur family